MTEVEVFLQSYDGLRQKRLLALHDMLVNTYGLTTGMRYSLPFYFGKSWICYLSPDKKGGLELAFLRGNELSNEQGLLLFKDRKQVGGIDLMVEKIPIKQIKEVIQEAIELDHAIAYASKRNNSKPA